MKIKEFYKKNKKRIITAVILLVLIVGCVVYLMIPDSVDIAKVEKADIQASISEVGAIEADDAVTIYSPVAGKISEVLVNNNDLVEAGTVFVKYDLTSFKEEVALAEANKNYYSNGYNAALTKNNEYKEMLNKAEVEGEANKQIYAGLLESRDILEYQKEARTQTIEYNLKKLEAQLATLTSELSVASAEYENASSSGDSDAADDAHSRVSDLEEKIRSNRNALISFDTRSMTLEEYNVYLEVQRHLDLIDRFWNQNIEELNIAKQAIVSDSQISQYANSVKIADIQKQQANRNLEIAEGGLSVGYEGTVIEKMVNSGAVVEAGAPIAVIQPATGYKAKVMVSRFDIGKVAVGQKADISVGGVTYEGTVDSISPVAEKDQSNKPKVKVYVKLKDENAKPTIGLEADVKIYMDKQSDVLTVDDKAVYVDDKGSYVYVLDNGVVARKDISVGEKGNGKTEILDGLNENEQVIISPLTEDDIGSRRFAN